MTIITLADVKAKLGIPASDTSEDAAITPVVAAVCQMVYDRTGFDETATDHTDTLEDCQTGRKYFSLHRPIDTAIAITARGRTHAAVGTATWVTLAVDVTDARRGRFAIIGPSNYFQVYPPTEPPVPWFRWQSAIWTVVEFTYKTTASGASWPADLVAAAADLAGFGYRRGFTSNLLSASLDGISESYGGTSKAGSTDIIPPEIRAAFSRYARKRTSGWVP